MRPIPASALVSAVLAAALGTCGPLIAQAAAAPQAAEPTRYSARAFFETTTYQMAAPGAVAFSRDGRALLVTSDASGVFNAYLLPLGGGEPVALTSSTTDAVYGESLFPSDDRLLYSADQGGNELDHLYVRAVDGTTRDLTPGEKLKASFEGWSADGKRFFVATNERDPKVFDLYAYDAASYERELIFQNTGFVIGDVSGDGRHVALVAAHSSANSDLHVAEIGAQTEPRLITPHEGNVDYQVYGFTPDGRTLVYGTDQHGEYFQAWAYDLASGAAKPLVEASWDVMFLQHSPTGRYRVHALNEDASTALTITDTRSGQPVALRGVPAGDLGSVRFDAAETRIAFTVASDTSPADVFVADLASGEARRLTRALSATIDEDDLVQATVARFRSYDGVEVPGILYRPHGASAARPAPAIVWVHGGPGGQSRRGYSATIQHLVNHGFAIYAINNRGSSGYGKTFFHLDDRKHGDVDLKDLVAARDWLAGMDWISDRIAVMGGSYGGFLTAAALAFHPETFDAGVNIFGVTNWVRTLESMPPWWGAQRQAIYDEMGDPAVDATRHRAISPLFHAAKIRRPLLVVQGANDPRVLQVESDEIVAAVRKNGVPVEYVLFPDEGHGFLKKDNRIQASESFLAFLDQHLRAPEVQIVAPN